MEYPKYVSHKVVGAVQIGHVEKCADGSILVHLKDGYESVRVPHAERNHKPQPEAGWYLVQYPDGYISFSPKKAFEEGYVSVTAEEAAAEIEAREKSASAPEAFAEVEATESGTFDVVKGGEWLGNYETHEAAAAAAAGHNGQPEPEVVEQT